MTVATSWVKNAECASPEYASIADYLFLQTNLEEKKKQKPQRRLETYAMPAQCAENA